MTIHNPFPIIEHKVYSRTFMREASASIEFPEVSLPANVEKLAPYFKENFNVDINPEGSTNFDTIKISTEKTQQQRFSFDKSNAKVTFEAGNYHSFAATMQPNIGKLVSFISTLGIEQASKITLRKKNVWDISSEDSMSAFKAAIPYIFKEKDIQDVAKYNIPETPRPLRISNEANINLGEGLLIIQFFVEISNDKNIRLVLDLEASAPNVKSVDILETSSALNDVIYGAFHELVTQDILNLMEGQNE